MRILVLGAGVIGSVAGVIGSVYAVKLLQAGHAVHSPRHGGTRG